MAIFSRLHSLVRLVSSAQTMCSGSGGGGSAQEPSSEAADADARAEVEVEVEVDQDNDDAESGYGDEVSTASTSIRSSILRYEWKHGRRYHGYQAGAYNFPNDDREQDRLDMVHHIYYRALNDRLFLAPIDPEGLHILDIGTGTGVWPIHLADLYPGASVVGNDLSPIQPQWVPPNVQFIVDDVELEWSEPEKYDFIHCRYMAGSIKDWPRLFGQIYDNLKPGGWVEFQESANMPYSEDDSLRPDNALVRLMEGLMDGCKKIGRTMDPAPSFQDWAREMGFERVEERRFKLPVGSWPKDPRLKEIGSFLSLNFTEGVEAFTAVIFKEILGWSAAEVEILNAQVRAVAKSREIHPIFDFLVVTAMKPL